MKIEFELTLDDYGNPCIRFEDNNNSDDLYNKVLNKLIMDMYEKGIEITEIPASNLISRAYEIKAKK